MGLNYYASSPTVVLPPQQPSYFDNLSMNGPRSISPNSCALGRKYPVPPSLNYLAASNTSAAGRKRSIADVEPEDLPADCPMPVQEPPPKPKIEPIYGPGMTLIYPNDPGFQINAESQTGTWAEEKHDIKKQASPPARPIAVSRKSQRLDSTKTSSTVAQQSPAPVIDANGNTVDSLVFALGIGWKNVMTNPALSIAVRAYNRVIENHFPLTDATIMLQSEALSAYFVRAKDNGVEKYWLFDDSLGWCQLLSNSLQGAVANLRAGPVPAVEGPIINSTPRTPPSGPALAGNDCDMGPAPAVLPVDGDAMQL